MTDDFVYTQRPKYNIEFYIISFYFDQDAAPSSISRFLERGMQETPRTSTAMGESGDGVSPFPVGVGSEDSPRKNFLNSFLTEIMRFCAKFLLSYKNASSQ